MALPNMQPLFPATLAIGKAVAATANTDLTGTTTTNMVTVYSAAAAASGGNGSRIDRIVAIPTATCAAGLVRLFLHDGTTPYPFKEITIPAGTVNTTTASPAQDVVRTDGLPVCHLPAGWSLRATTTITQDVQIVAFAADY